MLAGDRMSSDEWLTRATRKVHRLRGHLVGAAGNSAVCREALAWFGRGASVDDFPASMRDRDEATSLLVIVPGTLDVLLYQGTPWPIELFDPLQAIGSGADAAVAAMLCGKTAAEAVAIASIRCRGVCGGVDFLTFDE